MSWKPMDVHSHMVPVDLLKELGSEVSEANGLFTIKTAGRVIGPVTRGFFEVDSRKRENMSLGIGVQVLSMTHHLFLYKENVDSARKVSRKFNKLMGSICRDEGSFICNATVPLQDPKIAAEELEETVSEGLKGVEIGTNVAGKNLDDPSLWPFYEKAQELTLPILVHPADIMSPDRMRKYYMEIVVGTLAETTVAITSLLFGGVLRQFPKLKFVFCHGGGAVPYQIGRLRRATEVREDLKGIDVWDLRKLYFDAVLFEPLSLEFLVKTVGVDRVVLGTDYPFNMGDWRAVEIVKRTSLNEEDKMRIAWRNAVELYGRKL